MAAFMAMAALDYINFLLTTGLKQREADFGARFEWNGAEYPCSSGILNSEKKITDGGFSTGADVVLTIRTALFPGARPAENHNCRYKPSPTAAWQLLRIESIVTPPGDAYLQLACNGRHQGA